MKNYEYDFESLLSYLPEGWEEKAKESPPQKPTADGGKELGAITCSRKIKNAAELLRMNLLYLTSGGSFGKTSAMMKLTADQGLNKNATDEAGHGSKGADDRLHYCVDLFTLKMIEMHLTGASTGETLCNFKQFQKGDLVLADRAYSSIKAIGYLNRSQSDFVLRCRSNTFAVYNCEGEKLSLPDLLEDMKEQEFRSLQLFYKQQKQLLPIRICVMRKSMEADYEIFSFLNRQYL